jgi:uncharacterized protein YegL
MPRLGEEGMVQGKIGKGFTFTGTRIEKLTSTLYTLVDIQVDVTGSVEAFEDDLTKMLQASVEGCRKCPTPENLLVRVSLFSDRFPGGTSEIHGFKPLAEIDTSKYPALVAGGMTPLCDACYSGIGAVTAYGKQLTDQEYTVNAITFVITDGFENASTTTPAMVKALKKKAISGEQLESFIGILIGVNAAQYAQVLATFKDEAGLDKYIDVKDVNPQELAKLAAFVSQSVSSQSQALGTGGPSQSIAATI